MSQLAIRAEGLSKEYRLGQFRSGYQTLREHLSEGVTTVFRPSRRKQTGDFLWALKDVSFEVEEGEVVGVIGRNGAGKTTLLRTLGRITEPTSGFADVTGRLGCLLEVGTGFHPELSGRDNIFLNGAILGMRRSEVARRFDEIVEFAGVEKFLDTPVKRYSSGMYVRLAFAVAAHLEPEILLIDEVLAVGDADFQRRCLGKMESMGEAGRTVLFVSHNMPVIARLCPRLLLFEGGRLVQDGPTDEVIARYLLSDHGTSAKRDWPDIASAPGDGAVRLRSIRVVDAELTTSETLDVQEPVGIEVIFDVLEPGCTFAPWIDLFYEDGQLIFSAIDTSGAADEPRERGRYTTIVWLPEHLFNESTYTVSVSLKTLASRRPVRRAEVEAAVSFHIVDRAGPESARGQFQGRMRGFVRPMLRWTTEHAGDSADPLVAGRRAAD